MFTTTLVQTTLPLNVKANVQVVPQTLKRSQKHHGQLDAPHEPRRRICDDNFPTLVLVTSSTPTLNYSVYYETLLKHTRTLSGRMAVAYNPMARVCGENLAMVNPMTAPTLKRTRIPSNRMARAKKPTFGSRMCDDVLPALWLAAAEGARLGYMG